MTAKTLDCGHPPSSHSDITTGYGQDSNGRTYCYSCCADRDRADMIETGRATLYLVKRADWHVITNWPSSLEFRAHDVSRSPRGGGFGSQRTDAWFTGPDGFIWHAINRGDMDLARCRRTARKA